MRTQILNLIKVGFIKILTILAIQLVKISIYLSIARFFLSF